MEKIKQYKYIILIVLIILAGAFYWFQLRPTMIRKECSKLLTGFGSIGLSGERNYNNCLLQNGLKE